MPTVTFNDATWGYEDIDVDTYANDPPPDAASWDAPTSFLGNGQVVNGNLSDHFSQLAVRGLFTDMSGIDWNANTITSALLKISCTSGATLGVWDMAFFPLPSGIILPVVGAVAGPWSPSPGGQPDGDYQIDLAFEGVGYPIAGHPQESPWGFYIQGGINVTSTQVFTSTAFSLEVTYQPNSGADASITQLPIEIVYSAMLLLGVAEDINGWGALVPASGPGPYGHLIECACCGTTAESLAATVAAGTGDPMSTVAIGIINPLQQWLNDIGEPLADGTITFYAAGTSDLLDTWSNESLTTLNTNPVQLDGDGKAVVYMGPFVYKIDLKDEDGVSQSGYPRDYVAGSIWVGRLAGAATLSPAANSDGYGHQLASILNKAATGTHPLFAGLYLGIPTINVGGATLSESATVYIVGPPTVGTLKYALHIAAGILRVSGSLLTDPVAFAALPAAPVEGQRAFITDCNTTTFAAAAAGGGTDNVPVYYNGSSWRVG